MPTGRERVTTANESWAAVAAAAALLVAPGLARAQAGTLAGAPPVGASEDASPSVLAEKNALGLPLGGFTLLPQLKISAAYDDNIYRVDHGKIDDGVFTVRPSVNLRSNWLNQRLDLSAYSIHTRYADQGQNDTDQYQVGGEGMLTIRRTWTLNGSASYGHLIEPRGTPGNDFTFGRFALFNATNLALRVDWQLNRVVLKLGASTNRRKYDDIHDAGGPIDQSYRDHHIDTLLARADYQLDATTSLFVSASPSRYVYSRTTPLLDRSSHSFTVLGGVDTELTRLIKGEIGIGYLQQKFEEPYLKSFHGMNYNANITYSPTPLTTVLLAADRTQRNSGILAAASVLTSEFRLSVDHELLRRLHLQAFVEHDTDQYRGIPRVDHRLYLGVSGDYEIRRYLTLSPFYKYQSRSIKGYPLAIPHNDNQIGVSLVYAP